MNLHDLKIKHKTSLFQLLQKCEEIFDGILVKYTGSDHELIEDAKPYPTKPFPISKFTNQHSKKKIID